MEKPPVTISMVSLIKKGEEMLEEIRKRRSVRKYEDKPVSDEKIEQLLRAAMQAPSARNLQPWEFIVLKDKKTLAIIPEFHPYSAMVPSAGAAILVCGNMKRQSHIGYIVQDCSAAVQNILLEVVNQELGAVWLGIYPREERMQGMKKLFNLPDYIMPVALISIGVPAEHPEFEDRHDGTRIHNEQWS